MTLLAPISALVAGAIGGSLLLVMYMLRLRRRPVRVSSVMFWGDPPKDLEANIPLRMVKPAWTLLLQALAIALLALALGRPAIDAVGGSSDRLYILIDRSASMGARDAMGGATRLEAAKARALDIVSSVGGLGGAEAMLIPFASRAASATSMTSDRGLLSQAVRAIEPTEEAGDLSQAMALVAALIASEAGEGSTAGAARVVLLSDGAFAPAPPGATRQLAGARLEFEPVPLAAGVGTGLDDGPGNAEPAAGAWTRDNIAVAALAAQRDDDEPARVRVFIRLISVRSQSTPITLVLTIDGQELARRAIVVPAAALPDTSPESRESRNVTPGEQSVALEFVRPEGGVLRAGIDRADALTSDNQAAVVVPPVGRASILLVAPGEPDFFLRNVLEELDNVRVRVIDEAAFLSPTGADMVDEADLIVLDRVRPPLEPAKPTLSIGAGLPIAGLDTHAETSGALPPNPNATPTQSDPNPATPATRPTGAAQWDREHPALLGVTLDSLHVSRPMALVLSSSAPASASRVLASGRDGPLILESRSGSIPRILVAFALHDSNWPVQVGFPVFIASAVEHLVYGGDPGRGRSSRAGEAITPALRANDPSETRNAASTGSGPPATITAFDDAGRQVATGTGSIVLERAGVYTLRSPAAPDTQIAVNPGDEFESRLASSDRVQIAGESITGTPGAPRPRELWFWFVLAAGVLMMIEWLVYLRAARV